MPKREPIRIPLDFEQALGELIKVKPPDRPEKSTKAKKRAAKRGGRKAR